MNSIILLLNFASTWAMVGLIWFVQVVHYPLFAQVGTEQFVSYETAHTRLTTYVVLPLMFTELLTAFGMLVRPPSGSNSVEIVAGMLLVLFIWAMTFTVQVPQHGQLSVQYDDVVQRNLVNGNWWRTIAWTARGLLTIWLVGKALLVSSPVNA